MFKQVLAAKERLRGYVNVTPVITSRTINRLVGAEVYFNVKISRGLGHSSFAEHSTVFLNFRKQRKRVVSLLILQGIMHKQ